jgi:hypothetical protein
MFLIRLGTPNENCSKNFMEFCILIGLYFNKTLKMCSIIFYQPFLHLLVEGLNVVIYPSLFNIS